MPCLVDKASKDPFGFGVVRQRKTSHYPIVKVMVFGASEMAGAAFCSAAVRRGFETKAFSHRNPVKVDGIAGHTRLDLNDLNDLERPLLEM